MQHEGILKTEMTAGGNRHCPRFPLGVRLPSEGVGQKPAVVAGVEKGPSCIVAAIDERHADPLACDLARGVTPVRLSAEDPLLISTTVGGEVAPAPLRRELLDEANAKAHLLDISKRHRLLGYREARIPGDHPHRHAGDVAVGDRHRRFLVADHRCGRGIGRFRQVFGRKGEAYCARACLRLVHEAHKSHGRLVSPRVGSREVAEAEHHARVEGRVVVWVDSGTNRARPRDHDSFSRVQVADRRPPDERITEREHGRDPAGVVDDAQAVVAAVEFETGGNGRHGE